ncbi:1-acylglycerol-3-phosphate O-acyltransferase PNPLA3 [Perognathus longimembris pacificus]|uniref:1-acylglycerol-3-phosphate O-acyltransferase PNPLA3 n=1 Tax=Perognathus longimembris pacificus TaxID=214514 RepID=UPI002019355E|nr:1-acylglycerol-3-phosphate O-acyltransferase PNPLA3 [Perognathus longimembris pacificus]
MYEPGRPWSLSFVGCGFLSFYHIGATRCLCERAPHLVHGARWFFGSSFGALHCVVFLSRVPLERALMSLVGLVRKARRGNMSSLHPFFNINKSLRDELHARLPPNVHQLVAGKLYISLTRVSDGENVLVSDFRSRDEVVDAVLCSCFIPFFSGLIPPSFRGVRYMDGGLSNNVPLLDARSTITVSPFYGEHDICPKVKSTNFLHLDINHLSFRLCKRNIYFLCRAFFPPDPGEVREICFQGYVDAFRFLEENGMGAGPQPGPSLSSRETEPGDSGPGLEKGSALGDTRWDTLRLSIMAWDEATFGSLSPRLTTALNEAIKDRGGYLSRLGNLLPVRILSYALQPCTLPVESAIATVWRLVTWLPDLPEDIQWLHWATWQVCVRASTCLLPSFR